MIERLVLKNFQKHERLVLDLDPTITVLVGPTDGGKSAVFRALRFLLLNKLVGSPDSYITWDKSTCRVSGVVDGKRLVRARNRKKGGNYYRLDDKKYVFDGVMRKGVPDPIAELLKVGPENFQRQMDAQFWLSDSNSQFAKNLNQIVNLEIMDRVLVTAIKSSRVSKVKVSLSQERLQEARSEYKSLQWAEVAHDLLSNLEKKNERLKKIRDRIAYTGRLIETAVNARVDGVRASEGLPEAGKAVLFGERALNSAGRVKAMKNLVQEAIRLRESSGIVVPNIKPLLNVRTKADATAESRRSLDHLLSDEKVARKYSIELEEELCRLKTRLKKESKDVVCPTCRRPMS